MEQALAALDAQGPGALNIRKLSTELRISPNTLYQQVGNQEELTRALVARHFSRLEIAFTEYPAWDETARQWCRSLYEALVAHPYLTELMTIDDRKVITRYVDPLLTSALAAGIPRSLAVECCRALTTVTINQASRWFAGYVNRRGRRPRRSRPSG